VVGAFREGERFQQGVEWEQRPLDTPGIVAFDDLCKQVSNEPGVGRLFEDAVAFRVTHGVECTPVGETAAEMEARAVSRLVSWEEKDVEHTVWSSATPKLVDGAAPGVVDDAVAIAQAEAFAADWNMQGVINHTRCGTIYQLRSSRRPDCMLDVFLFPRHETRNGPGFHLSRSLTHRGTFHAMGDTESDRVLKQPPNTRLI
jgi:hypothetical protein